MWISCRMTVGGLYTTNSRKGVFKLVDNDKSMYSNDENKPVSFKRTLILFLRHTRTPPPVLLWRWIWWNWKLGRVLLRSAMTWLSRWSPRNHVSVIAQMSIPLLMINSPIYAVFCLIEPVPKSKTSGSSMVLWGTWDGYEVVMNHFDLSSLLFDWRCSGLELVLVVA